MTLQDEITSQRRRIHTDAYPMSIGEIINMYRDGDLYIHPAYQRLFRWSDEQKALLIDSILLRIPLPSIFVAQRADAKWEIIDGLQRVSTILELAGVLRDSDGQLRPPLRLVGTPSLPSLAGKSWDTGPDQLSSEERLLIKQAKLDVKIILRESDEASKYELFKRLNTGGSALTHQEVRTCIAVMINPDFALWLRELCDFPDYRATIPLTDNQISQQYDLDLVSRFFALKGLDLKDQTTFNDRDINEVVTDRIVAFASSKSFNREREAEIFKATFQKINAALGENAFKRYDDIWGKFKGPPVVSCFEVIALGLGFHEGRPNKDITAIAKDLAKNAEFISRSGAGVRATTRVLSTLHIGRELFG